MESQLHACSRCNRKAIFHAPKENKDYCYHCNRHVKDKNVVTNQIQYEQLPLFSALELVTQGAIVRREDGNKVLFADFFPSIGAKTFTKMMKVMGLAVVATDVIFQINESQLKSEISKCTRFIKEDLDLNLTWEVVNEEPQKETGC